MADGPVRFKHRVEYVALRLLSGLLRRVPYRAALALAWGLAWLGHRVAGFRRAEARRRIRQVLGPERSEREIHRIAWISWRNICFNAVEIARLPGLDRRWLDAHTDYGEMERVRARMQTGTGAIMAVPHAGNWDLCGVGCHLNGFPVFFIARRQKNPLTDAYLNRMRGATGVATVLNDAGLLRGVMRNLKAGMMLAILPDVRARTPALAIRFLGGEANLGAGATLFARQTGVPIFPAFITREGWTRHRVHVLDPVEADPQADKEADRRRMLQQVMDALDRCIRERPEQYFWFNKRWVLDPMAREKIEG